MALEHPQKQYRYGQDDGRVCIILSSQGQRICLLCSKQKFKPLGGGGEEELKNTGLMNNYDELQNYKKKLTVAGVFTSSVLH